MPQIVGYASGKCWEVLVVREISADVCYDILRAIDVVNEGMKDVRSEGRLE